MLAPRASSAARRRLATQCHRRREAAREERETTPDHREQRRRGAGMRRPSQSCAVSRPEASPSRPFFLLQRARNSAGVARLSKATTTIAWPLLLRKMLYSGLARAEEPAQFFMYHGGVAVSSAACTLGVAERAPGIKRGTGTADATILCACIRIRRCPMYPTPTSCPASNRSPDPARRWSPFTLQRTRSERTAPSTRCSAMSRSATRTTWFTPTSMNYNEDTGEARAEGHVELDGGPADEHILADHATLNLDLDTGRFYNVTGSVGRARERQPQEGHLHHDQPVSLHRPRRHQERTRSSSGSSTEP